MKEAAERKKEFRTTVGGTAVKRVYTPTDLAGFEEDSSLIREYPFTRHVMPTGYRGRLGTMRQYAGFATIEELKEYIAQSCYRSKHHHYENNGKKLVYKTFHLKPYRPRMVIPRNKLTLITTQ